MKKFIIITTIHEKSQAIESFEKLPDWHIIVVGDRNTPKIVSTENLTFLSLNDQLSLGFKIAEILPVNHYARKNIGYLYAIRQGADIIYDTDDDNFPYAHWNTLKFNCNHFFSANSQFVNAYKYFSDRHIWPRGFPLNEISNSVNVSTIETRTKSIGVWQGLADIDPDVDAIYRLLFNKKVVFKKKKPVALPSHVYCPFNSQNTTWNKNAFFCLYLPSSTSFRFTDILRSYIAQRLLWEHGLHLGFMKATVYQERNSHDLMKDFSDEIECYTNIQNIVQLLEKLNCQSDPYENLVRAYERLIQHSLIESKELFYLNAWISDIQNLFEYKE